MLTGLDGSVMDLEQTFPALTQLMNFAVFVSFLSMVIHLGEKLFM